MKRVFFALCMLAAAAWDSGCTRTITDVQFKTDTVLVTRMDTLVRTDTVFKTHVDTVTKPVVTVKVDTVIKTDTFTTPPRVDTVITTRVDTVKTVTVVTRVDTVVKADTILLPGAVVHDTAWIYTQANPTNPLGGGDPKSGLLVMNVWIDTYVVFWHGNFVGVVNLDHYPDQWLAWGVGPISDVNAYLTPMSVFCHASTWQAAAQCLVPIEMVLKPNPVLIHASGYPLPYRP